MGRPICPSLGHGQSLLQASQALFCRAIPQHPCNISHKSLIDSRSAVNSRQRQRLSVLNDPLRNPARRWLHVASAGGPSGGLQKTKRVGGGQVCHFLSHTVHGLQGWLQKLSHVAASCLHGDLRPIVCPLSLGMVERGSVPVLMQVDTPVRKLLLGIAVTYTALIVILPFLNVFYQVVTSPCL